MVKVVVTSLRDARKLSKSFHKEEEEEERVARARWGLCCTKTAETPGNM